jgi:hypothetical protein
VKSKNLPRVSGFMKSEILLFFQDQHQNTAMSEDDLDEDEKVHRHSSKLEMLHGTPYRCA